MTLNDAVRIARRVLAGEEVTSLDKGRAYAIIANWHKSIEDLEILFNRQTRKAKDAMLKDSGD